MDQTPPPVPPPPGTSIFELEIDAVGQNHLNTISRWGKFIAVTCLICIIISILLLATQYDKIIEQVREFMAFDQQGAGILLGVMIVFIAIVLAWLIFLLRGCSLIRRGVIGQNSDLVADGFRSLRVVFTISVVISSLAILTTILGLASR